MEKTQINVIHHNKLVRDKIPEILDEKGLKYSYDILSTEEYEKELLKKLKEEMSELETALEYNNTQDIIDEIADIITVLDYIVIARSIDINYLQKYAIQKTIDRGGFDKKIFLKWVKLPTSDI